MAFNWENIRFNIRKYPKSSAAFFLYSLFWIAIAGCGLYASIVLLPIISTALAFTFLPYAAIALIAALALLYYLGVLLNSLLPSYFSLHVLQLPESDKATATRNFYKFQQYPNFLVILTGRFYKKEGAFFPEFISILADPPSQASTLGAKIRNFLMLDVWKKINNDTWSRWRIRLLIPYAWLANIAALGLAIFLSLHIVPAIISALSAAAFPFAMAVFLGVISALVLTALIRDFLHLPLIINNTYFNLKYLGFLFQGKTNFLLILSNFLGLVAAVSAAYPASLVFPVVMMPLLTLLSPGLATFTALAVCFGVVSTARMLGILLPWTITIIIDILQNKQSEAVKSKNEQGENPADTLLANSQTNSHDRRSSLEIQPLPTSLTSVTQGGPKHSSVLNEASSPPIDNATSSV